MAERHGGPVVVGVDGSESGSDAVRWAASEALGRGVGLRVVAVYTPLPRTRHTLGLESAYREQMTAALRGRPRSGPCSPSGWPATRASTPRSRCSGSWCGTARPGR